MVASAEPQSIEPGQQGPARDPIAEQFAARLAQRLPQLAADARAFDTLYREIAALRADLVAEVNTLFLAHERQASEIALLRALVQRSPGQALHVVYTNHAGRTEPRKIRPIELWFGATQWHPEPGWLLNARDTERGVVRDFSVAHMRLAPEAPSAATTLPPSLQAKPNIPWERQTLDQLVAERDYWADQAKLAPGFASAKAADNFRKGCEAEIRRRTP